MNLKKLLRPCVKNFAPYQAGKPVETVKKELRLKKVIKLASNENPLGPSALALKAVETSLKKINLYPDSASAGLVNAIAKKYLLSPKNIVVGGGSDELIEIIAKTFFNPSDNIVVSKHAFIRYKMAGDLMGTKVIEVPMVNYTHDLIGIAKAVTSKTKAVFIANPNNPTGTYNTKEEIKNFLNSPLISRLLPLVIIDEAYYEYARTNSDYPETLLYLSKYPNLIILRTFSKIFGLAGLRIGYALTSANIAEALNRIRPPFNVSIPAQAAGVAALNDSKHLTKSLALVESEKKYIYDALDKFSVKYVKSAGNFILFSVYPKKGKDIFAAMLRKGIIVRSMDEYELPHHIRVTIGNRSANKLFVKAFSNIWTRSNK